VKTNVSTPGGTIVLTTTGCIELGAAIMNGRSRRGRRVRPARRALRSALRGGCSKGPHVFLSGHSADVTRGHGFESRQSLVRDRRRRRLMS
jgi:isoaspartyl peptidase/L-asparaginase-like protein (Ntn-hydrolase superfamily)